MALAAIPAAIATVAPTIPAMFSAIPAAMTAVPAAIGAKMAGTAAATQAAGMLPTGGSLYPLIEGGLGTAAGGGGLPSWMTLGNLQTGMNTMTALDQLLQQPGGSGVGMAPTQPAQFAPPPGMEPSAGANLPSPFMGGGTPALPGQLGAGSLSGLPPEIIQLLLRAGYGR